MAAFEPDGYVREPAGGAHTHRGTAELRALYERFLSSGGGIRLEHCAVADNGRACALEYNVAAWGRTAMPPEAGIAVYVRGDRGKLAAARIYDDTDPPLTRSWAQAQASGSDSTTRPPSDRSRSLSVLNPSASSRANCSCCPERPNSSKKSARAGGNSLSAGSVTSST